MHLPHANVPFPVEVPFRTVADLYKLPSWLHGEWQQDYFCLDDTLESYLSCRLHELRHHADYCRCVLRDDEGGLEPSLWQVFHLIAKDKPQLVELHDDGVTLKALGISLSKTLSLSRHEAIFPELAAACYEHLDKQEGLYRLADCLSLAVQEDLVIMRSDAEGDKAECLLVAMPSHWNPQEKLGRNFAQIHQPVADNNVLIKSAPNVMRAMFEKGPFVRFGWSISKTPSLAQNPAVLWTATRPLHETAPIENLLEKLYFRVERQTIFALNNRRSLFAIRIFMEPLAQTLKEAPKRERFGAALASMSAEMVAYKGLIPYRTPLVDYCLNDSLRVQRLNETLS